MRRADAMHLMSSTDTHVITVIMCMRLRRSALITRGYILDKFIEDIQAAGIIADREMTPHNEAPLLESRSRRIHMDPRNHDLCKSDRHITAASLALSRPKSHLFNSLIMVIYEC
jgi:hypothetical protein